MTAAYRPSHRSPSPSIAVICPSAARILDVKRLIVALVLGYLGAVLTAGLTAHGAPWSAPTASTATTRPHPAVARIIVPERGATSYGSGTLIDARDKYGLVITNWHVVRDGTGTIEVVFPDGFRSAARALKVDHHWDLAALVIWRPPAEPVPLATTAPRPGELLTIAGYGKGNYRAVSGYCTQYVAPAANLPFEMVELNVEARQGDSGGPIFNSKGELAGVLFGAGRGTTSGSYCGRVSGFLASLSPDIGQDESTQIASTDRVPLSTPQGGTKTPGKIVTGNPAMPAADPPELASTNPPPRQRSSEGRSSFENWATSESGSAGSADWGVARSRAQVTNQADDNEAAFAAMNTDTQSSTLWQDVAGATFLEQAKTVLAGMGLLTLVLLAVRLVGG